MKNERGSALLTVMLAILILTTLGLVIMSVSLQGAKRTEVREDEVIENTEALTNLKKGVAYIESLVEKNNNWVNDEYYHKKIEGTYDSFTITLANPNYEHKTREFLVTDTEGIYSQKVYVTAMPSFLKYAIGARHDLTINGSVNIEGDIYAKNELNISDVAQYVYNSVDKTQPTSLPSILDKNFVVVENEATMASLTNKQKENKLFNPGEPFITKKTTGFVEANILNSFIEKINTECPKSNLCKEDPLTYNASIEDISSTLTEQYNTYIESLLADKLDEETEDKDMPTIEFPLRISGNEGRAIYYYEGSALIDSNQTQIQSNDWVIINGNARFKSEDSQPVNVLGNYLITGKADLFGNLNLDSVMYVLGDTTLYDANINNDDKDAYFILMTEGELEIANLNEFRNPDEDNTEINGFLYTTKQATVYGVGSLLRVNGGIFSQSNLTLNAYRGKASKGQTDLLFIPKEEETYSRLKVTNNKRLYIDEKKLYALPNVDKLDVITDRINKVK